MRMMNIGMKRFADYNQSMIEEKKMLDFEESMREIKSHVTAKKCLNETATVYRIPVVQF